MLAPTRERANARSNWQSYPTYLRKGAGFGQVEAMQFLLDRGIACKRGVGNAHQEPAYRDASPWACGPDACPHACARGTCRRLATSERLRDSMVLLPLYHGMTVREQEQVLEALAALDRAAAETR